MDDVAIKAEVTLTLVIWIIPRETFDGLQKFKHNLIQ